MGKLLRSIRSKFIVWFLLVSLIPLIVTALFSYDLSSKELLVKEEASIQNSVNNRAAAINVWLERRMEEIKLASKTEILHSGDITRIATYMNQILAQSDVYEDMLYAGSDGIVKTATNEVAFGVNITDRNYYQLALKGEASYSEILTSKGTGNRVITVASPVLDKSGNMQALLIATINFEELVKAYIDNGTSEFTGMSTILVDENKKLQLSPIEEHVGKTIEESGITGKLATILDNEKKGSGLDTYASSTGEEYLISYSYISETGYSLFYYIPLDTVLASADTLKDYIVIIIVVAAILVILLSLYISNSISKPIVTITAQVQRVAKGDLTEHDIKVKSKDEVGELAHNFQLMTTNLRAFVNKVSLSSEQVAAASQQISASTEEVASGSSSQADAAQTMSDLFRELTVAINSVARGAEQASDLSNRTMEIAQDGGKVVQSSIDGMNMVNEQMSRLEEDSIKIGEIIEVIDDIADQTNLLALNAAIEAARAGDQGRGFAVVADEVRKLAERSSEATKQITSIIKGMQVNTEQSVKAVLAGVSSSQQTGEAFEEILSMVNESANKVTEIAAASEQQAAQSSEVMVSIESISTATEEAAASSEETASTAQSLAHLAEELNNAVSTYKIR